MKREEELNRMLAAFFHSGTRKCDSVTFGGAIMGWAVVDDATYDGEQLGVYDTPLDAIKDWYDTDPPTQVKGRG